MIDSNKGFRAFLKKFLLQIFHLQRFLHVWVYKQFYLNSHTVYFTLWPGLCAAHRVFGAKPAFEISPGTSFDICICHAGLVDLFFVSGQKFSSGHFSILSTTASCLAKTRSFFRSIALNGSIFWLMLLQVECWVTTNFMLIQWLTIDSESQWGELTTQFISPFNLRCT